MTNTILRVVLLTAVSALCLAVQFRILNREIGDIWVGIQGNHEHPHLNNGGFVLPLGKRVSVEAPSNWSGLFWARTWCNETTKHCETGDCGKGVQCDGAPGELPVTLVEITLQGFDGKDFYDVTLVSGFNIMVSIEPVRSRIRGGRFNCKKSACQIRLDDICPEKLKLTKPSGVVACQSACTAFNTDQYCCRGDFGRPDKCKTSEWPVNYVGFFKSRCPNAYAYAYDDFKATFTCRSEAYRIIFGGWA